MFGNLIETLRNFFQGERPPPPPPPPVADRRAPREERRERQTKGRLVVEELARVSSAHQASELLKGITFNVNTLENNDALADLLLGILNADPTVVHDPRWLRRQREALEGRRAGLAGNPDDQDHLENIIDKIDGLLDRIETHRRKVEVVKELKREVWKPEETVQRERGAERLRREERRARGEEVEDIVIPTPEERRPWRELVRDLPDDIEGRPIDGIADIKGEADQIEAGNIGDREERLHKFSRGFAKVTKSLIREMSVHPTPENARRFEQFQQTAETVARQIVDRYGSHVGRLDYVLRGAEGELIERRIREDPDYRDYWFYHILENVLYNKGESHRDLYNLYEMSDMTSFMDIVRTIRTEEDPKLGIRLAQRYTMMKNTIFQAHDMDFFSAHPMQELKDFIGSTSLFLNSYIDAAHQDPLVSLAKRAYEISILQVRDTNNGYVPREWLQWQEGKVRASKLDDMAEEKLRKFIEAGQLFAVKTDDINGLPIPTAWGRKQIDPTRPITMDEVYGYEPILSGEIGRNLGNLRVVAALKQAKGLAQIDNRFFEILSKSKGTGTSIKYYSSGDKEQPFNLALKQFNSVPYETIVRYLEPVVHYYQRFHMGGEYYDAFFNMLVTEWPHWNADDMMKIVEFHNRGDLEGMVDFVRTLKLPQDVEKTVEERLISQDNPWVFSGMWGPHTGWRMGDTTIGFDDWERDRTYGINVKLTTASNFAERMARAEFLENLNNDTYRGFREAYRNRLLDSNNIIMRTAAERDVAATARGEIDDEFEGYWQKNGLDQKTIEAGTGKKRTYRQILDDMWDLGDEKHGIKYENQQVKFLMKKLEKAYKTRVWVQAAMRQPLLAARILESKWEHFGEEAFSPLRKKIIFDILNIDVDQIAAMKTPLEKEEAGFNRIIELEDWIAAVQQNAIRESRDLRDSDFDVITDDMMRTNAKLYWQKVKNAVLGDFRTAEDFYRETGIDNPQEFYPDGVTAKPQGSRFYRIHRDVIDRNFFAEEVEKYGKKDIEARINFETELLNNKLLNREWRFMFSTEDMGWEYLNIGNLGERNPVRRAGDLAGHAQFGKLFEDYINNQLVARPKIEDLVKAQKEMWTALSEDYLDIAYNAMWKIANTTGLMYRSSDWKWKLPLGVGEVIALGKDASIMQYIRGRDRADAWNPNEELHYVQAIGGQQILPKRKLSGFGGRRLAPKFAHDTGEMARVLGATKVNVAWEILNMTILISVALTIFRAATAKSEEEE